MSLQSDRRSYTHVRTQLEDIATQIKDKDTSLDQCLDLYEEAIRLGNSCIELIDTTDFSAEELEHMMDEDAASATGEAVAAPVGEGLQADAMPEKR
jgi:exodeoxyribonuclease VII small subunit